VAGVVLFIHFVLPAT